MQIYNTLTRKIEEFIPFEENKVKMYTCGPTVYHYAHIGNLRTYVFEDILEKSLKFLGYKVERVMNITDVGHLESDADEGEDKMLLSAAKEKKTVYEIARYYEDAFFNDCLKLNIRKPDIVERATDHIDVYIEMITKLLELGVAYLSNNNIYFDITKANDYYQLSGKKADELKVGVRETVEEDKNKRNPQDFVLWFTKSKFTNQEMKWSSPWGLGYPGWHIECSGISYKFLGKHLDIHCGGVDNVFPHHTNEIAQSEAFLGDKWCKYWIHGEHLNDARGKMSKSSGETLTLELLEKKGYNPLSYRYFCLSSHYRNQLMFSFESLDGAEQAYNKLRARIKKLDKDTKFEEEKANKYEEQFKDAIKNDLNTSLMLTTIYDLLKDEELSDKSKIELVKAFDTVLSLDLIEEEKEVDKELEIFIKESIEKRNKAKQDKNYKEADEIRDMLLKKGIKLVDTKEGTTYEI